nr:immunoglobulin light chain junction region [Macaca mulatta]MOW36116.1 immunoglobulin light chain junction region [Macaca mulatta]MOW36142.1 immunoglobulin light chain junction region [Macaca mulatta]MOW36239.1 immunoglobulin light chain junction region [Macaca mulatta]MOW36256.1 immunoglobulin light chain junction region [Macaca mulatta]
DYYCGGWDSSLSVVLF